MRNFVRLRFVICGNRCALKAKSVCQSLSELLDSAEGSDEMKSDPRLAPVKISYSGSISFTVYVLQ